MKTVMLMMIACLLCTGCNTVKGVGQDVSKGGQEIERATR